MAFWRHLLAGSDWSHLLGVLSPSLFDVISARDLSLRAAELARNWFDRNGYLACVAGLEAALAVNDVGVDVLPSAPTRSFVPFRSELLTRGECPLAADGNALLRLFFFQIASSSTVLLDLRASRFCKSTRRERVVFRPLPLWTQWQPDFVESINQLYRGFYSGPHALFEQATLALGVSGANDVFERAFGGDRKRSSRYSLADFRDTFHGVFRTCCEKKIRLHPDFVTLGIMLATLYDHLETLGGVYDVQAAYESAQRSIGSADAVRVTV